MKRKIQHIYEASSSQATWELADEKQIRILEDKQRRSENRKNRKQIVIYYPAAYSKDGIFPLSIVRIPIDRLISKETRTSAIQQFREKLPPDNFNFGANTICLNDNRGPGLYMFGGWEPLDIKDMHVTKAHRYDLNDFEEIGSAEKLNDMAYGISHSIATQVGDDYIYVLGFDENKLVLQKYALDMNDWCVVRGCNEDIIASFDYGEWIRDQIKFAPHVVIGNLLHFSLGNRSFSFDTANNVWEDSNLFDTFWKDNEGFHFPSNFYGGKVWGDVEDGDIRGSGRGLPFGFYGRGIIWDKYVLLGFHCAPDCALVAFLLENGIVVKCQRFTLKQLGMDCGDNKDGMYGDEYLSDDACLVDLGRAGYFGLLHLVFEDRPPTIAHPQRFRMELVTFKISRPKPAASGDSFLECKFVRKDLVGSRKFTNNVVRNFHAFSV